MGKAVLCPVCQGLGKYYTPSSSDGSSTSGPYHICHGCNGRGWVEVSTELYPPKAGKLIDIVEEERWKR